MADISLEACTEIEVKQYKQISVNGSIPSGPLSSETEKSRRLSHTHTHWKTASWVIIHIIDEQLSGNLVCLSAHFL